MSSLWDRETVGCSWRVGHCETVCLGEATCVFFPLLSLKKVNFKWAGQKISELYLIDFHEDLALGEV